MSSPSPSLASSSLSYLLGHYHKLWKSQPAIKVIFSAKQQQPGHNESTSVTSYHDDHNDHDDGDDHDDSLNKSNHHPNLIIMLIAKMMMMTKKLVRWWWLWQRWQRWWWWWWKNGKEDDVDDAKNDKEGGKRSPGETVTNLFCELWCLEDNPAKSNMTHIAAIDNKHQTFLCNSCNWYS